MSCNQGRNSPGPESLWGFQITAGGAEKSQQCHKHLLQYSTFASERTQFRTCGCHLTSLRPCLQHHRILCGIYLMIRKQFFRVFQRFVPEVKYFCQKNTWKNSQIIFFLWKWFKTRKNFSLRICFGRSPSCPYRWNKFFCSYLKICVDCKCSCNSSRHQRFMREKFFKNEISENISQEFHNQWKYELTSIYFQSKGTSWKIDVDFRWFR